MIPLLSLGVPGDSVTAILLGAFIMKGIQPGPMMYVQHLDIVYHVFATLMLANFAMLLIGCLGVRIFAKIVSIEKTLLYPIILVISLLGAFSINKDPFDVGAAVVFGILGWLMNKYEFPLSPILLALILGPMCEQNFVRFMNIHHSKFFEITQSPIAMGFAAVSLVVIIYSIWNNNRINKRLEAEKLAAEQKEAE
jgi:putative tricarboxylic transport membrane protein